MRNIEFVPKALEEYQEWILVIEKQPSGLAI